MIFVVFWFFEIRIMNVWLLHDCNRDSLIEYETHRSARTKNAWLVIFAVQNFIENCKTEDPVAASIMINI